VTVRHLLVAVLAGCALLAGAPPAAAASQPVPYDEVQPAWQAGRLVALFVQLPQPGVPPRERSARTYLAGPQDPDAPLDAGGTFPTPDGGTVTVPAHDNVVDVRVTGARRRAACSGAFVVATDPADPRVLTRADPNGSGLRLAHAVLAGRRAVPLTASAVIERGIARGLLATIDLGYGGTCWTDPSAPVPH